MTGEIEKLIERCETLTEPCRETDAAIEAVLGCPCFADALPPAKDDWHWEFEADDDSGAVVVYMVLGNKTSKKFKKYSDPNYTSSIDAAMTLVPEGFHLHVLNQIDWPGEGWNVNLWGPPVPEGQRRFEKSYAKTAAIALCIAALRARSIDNQGK